MKQNKHIHDEDYNFSIKLMVPLLSILVCTICLCVTTWAWYTASITSGVNTISSGVSASINLSKLSGTVTDNGNNSYTAGPNSEFKLDFVAGSASNGYYALIDITNETQTASLSETIFGLFVNRVYAEDIPLRKAVYFSESTPNSITIANLNSSISKNISIKFVWADQVINENGDVSYKLDKLYSNDYTIEPERDATMELDKQTVLIAHFLDAETHEYLTSELSDTSTFGLNQEQTGLVEVYEFEGTSYEIYAPEGYLIVTVNENGEEINVQSIIFENLDEGETTEVSINCTPIKEKPKEETIQDDDVVTPSYETNNADTDQDKNGTSYEEEIIVDTGNDNKTTPDLENSDDVTDTSDTGSSDLADRNNKSEISNTDETDQSDTNAESTSDKPIESLFITDSNGEGTTETTPSSDETNSETDDVSE